MVVCDFGEKNQKLSYNPIIYFETPSVHQSETLTIICSKLQKKNPTYLLFYWIVLQEKIK